MLLLPKLVSRLHVDEDAFCPCYICSWTKAHGSSVYSDKEVLTSKCTQGLGFHFEKHLVSSELGLRKDCAPQGLLLLAV